MTQANLSEILFNPSFNPPETSTLMPRTRNKMSAAMIIPRWQARRQ